MLAGRTGSVQPHLSWSHPDRLGRWSIVRAVKTGEGLATATSAHGRERCRLLLAFYFVFGREVEVYS